MFRIVSQRLNVKQISKKNRLPNVSAIAPLAVRSPTKRALRIAGWATHRTSGVTRCLANFVNPKLENNRTTIDTWYNLHLLNNIESKIECMRMLWFVVVSTYHHLRTQTSRLLTHGFEAVWDSSGVCCEQKTGGDNWRWISDLGRKREVRTENFQDSLVT